MHLVSQSLSCRAETDFKAKMRSILQFQNLKCENLLPLLVLHYSKLNIFGFGAAADKTSNFKTSSCTLGTFFHYFLTASKHSIDCLCYQWSGFIKCSLKTKSVLLSAVQLWEAQCTHLFQIVQNKRRRIFDCFRA